MFIYVRKPLFMLDNKIFILFPLSTMSPERTLNTISRRHQDGPNQVAAETITNGSVDNIVDLFT